MIPACGQGILALQVCQDSPLLEMFDHIGDDEAQLRLELECLYLATVNGGCHIPVGSYAKIEDQSVHFYALLGDEEGQHLVKTDAVFALDEAKQKVIEIANQLKEQVYER